MSRTAVDPIERFNTKYRVDANGCWIWTAALFTNGYGAFRVGNRQVKAHRFSYESHVGPIPDRLLVCHQCDVKRCVNPKHLFLGTMRDNIADMDRKGRAPDRRLNLPATKLTSDHVRKIRYLYSAGLAKQQELADRFGVSQPTISQIVHHDTWLLPQ